MRTIQGLLGDRPRQRDLLIEYLHLIQDEFGQISAAHLAALAGEMRLAYAEVFETATFYAHFDVVKEDDHDIPALTVRVCDSLTCAMFGAEKLLGDLQKSLGDGVRVVRAPLRRTLRPRACRGGRAQLRQRRHCCERQGKRSRTQDTHPHIPEYVDYEAYAPTAATRRSSACAPAHSLSMKCSKSSTMLP